MVSIIFKFVEPCFMVQNMVILVNVSYALGKNVASAIVGLWKGRLG